MGFITVITVSMIVAFLNSTHVILRWLANKPDEMFTGIAHSFADYFLYVGAMAQGAAGRWIWAEHLFTNEPMAPTWYYWFYVSLGHLGSWIKLSPFATYNISLIIFVFALCVLWYALVKLLYPTNIFFRLTAWLFILTITNFASFARPGLAKLSISHIDLLGQFWFSPAPVFNRLGGVPYQVFQMILFILLAIIFSRLVAPKTLARNNSPSRSNTLPWFHNKRFYSLISLVIGNCQPKVDRPMAEKLVILAAIAFFAGSANPVQMLLFAVAALTTAAVMKAKRLDVIALLLLAAGTGAWMTYQEVARQAVSMAARAWELAQYVPNTLPILLLSIGSVLLFIPFGIRNVFNRHDPLRTLLLIWGLGSFAVFLSPVPRLLGLSPVRFLHPVPYAAALAILGIEGIIGLSAILHRQIKKLASKPMIYAGLIVLYLILTIPSISRQFTDRITPARNPQLLMDTIYNHVPAPIAEALSWLNKEQVQSYITRRVNPVPVVLVDPAIPIEVLIPVFTGLPSFSGHPIHTLYPDVKEAKRQEFFGGKMEGKEAKQFLNDHRIGYILTTPTGQLPMELRKVFTNAIVSIYESTN